MESQNKRKPLRELGNILPCQKYLQLVEKAPELKSKKKIFFQKKFSERDEYCFVDRSVVKDCSICFISDKDNEWLYFLHLLLESILGRLMLVDKVQNGDVKGSVTQKALKEFPVIDVSSDIIWAGAALDLTMHTIMRIMQEKEDALFLESARNLMEELRDIFVMELYAKPLFEVNNIEIVNSLVKLRYDCSNENLNEVVPHLLKGITDPNSELLSNIRRFRVLIGNMSNLLEQKK